EVRGDEIVCAELENGLKLWSRADDLIEEQGRQLDVRGGDGSWDLSALRPVRQPLEVSRAERGLVGVAIKVLDFFDVDLVGRSAMALARTFEEEQLGREPGLYRCSLAAPSKDGVPDLDPVAEGVLSASDDRPALL